LIKNGLQGKGVCGMRRCEAGRLFRNYLMSEAESKSSRE
jgi:hypothetical protein